MKWVRLGRLPCSASSAQPTEERQQSGNDAAFPLNNGPEQRLLEFMRLQQEDDELFRT